jgi:hypothetical protein
MALKDVNDDPISVVFIGIGTEVDVTRLKRIEIDHRVAGYRDSVRFVHYRTDLDQETLTKAALQDIPEDLQTYFLGRNIHPNPIIIADEIAVLPYSPTDDVAVPMEINQTTGEVIVTADVKPPKSHDITASSAMSELKKFSKNLHQNKTLRTIKRNINSRTVRQARQKVNRFVGHSIL